MSSLTKSLQWVQVADVAGVSCCSLSLVTSRPCRSLKLKLISSLLRPGSLLSLQIKDQSLDGAETSALQGLYCLVLTVSIVRPSSVSILTHWLVDIVLTLSHHVLD